jgi:ubiquinone/menaquinone biosynthesis C-methylase UbiE
MDRKAHWETIYQTKRPDQVSWFQREAGMSLAFIRRIAPDTRAATIDVGGGASTLIDGLLAAGYRELCVLDVSPSALAETQRRVGSTGAAVTWLTADVLQAELPPSGFDVWHDRAVFHFLIEASDRARYVAQARRAVRPGGHVLVAAFADDGPTQCSGLPVVRYTAGALHQEFGADFRLVESAREEHVTPSGAKQAFVYCLCQLQPTASKHHAA